MIQTGMLAILPQCMHRFLFSERQKERIRTNTPILCFTLLKIHSGWAGVSMKSRTDNLTSTWAARNQLCKPSPVASKNMQQQEVRIKSTAGT